MAKITIEEAIQVGYAKELIQFAHCEGNLNKPTMRSLAEISAPFAISRKIRKPTKTLSTLFKIGD